MSSFTTSINLPQGSSFSPPAWQPHLQRLCSLLVAFVHINLISSPRPLTPSVPAIPLISNLRVISSAFSSLWQSLSWRLNPDWTVHNSYERHLFFLLFYCQLTFLHFSPSVFCPETLTRLFSALSTEMDLVSATLSFHLLIYLIYSHILSLLN